jgi:hypothetical protein
MSGFLFVSPESQKKSPLVLSSPRSGRIEGRTMARSVI